MTLNGVIALTVPNRGVMSPNSVNFWTDYVKVVGLLHLLLYSRGLSRTSALRKIEYRNFGI